MNVVKSKYRSTIVDWFLKESPCIFQFLWFLCSVIKKEINKPQNISIESCYIYLNYWMNGLLKFVYVDCKEKGKNYPTLFLKWYEGIEVNLLRYLDFKKIIFNLFNPGNVTITSWKKLGWGPWAGQSA